MDERTTRIDPLAPPEGSLPSGGDAPGTTRVSPDTLEPLTTRVSPFQPTASRLPLGTVPPGEVLCGDCVVERTLHPHETQRPGLYLCRAPEGRVVVKVAPMQFPPRLALWERLPSLRHLAVLRTFRTVEEDGYFYDVQEYCAGGTLGDRVPVPGSGFPPVPPEWVCGVLVPQINAALQYLHAQDIVHRDLKPANIYVQRGGENEQLVLADFDISSVLESSRTSRDTQRAAGTWLYTAPEAFPRFIDDHAGSRVGRISRACDYYSLGITLIELLVGTTSLHQCQLPDLFDFYLQGGRVEIPATLPGPLNVLLHGLLLRNRRLRWGGDEVDRWLANANTPEDLLRITNDEGYELSRASRPYRLKSRVAVDLAGLADAMFQEQEAAMEELLSADVLLHWIAGINSNIAREINRTREQYRMMPAYVLHVAIQRCDPTRPFIFFDDTEVYQAIDWLEHVEAIADGPEASAALCTDELLHQFEAWLRMKEAPEPALADAVARLRETPPATRLEEVGYLIQLDRPFTIAPQAQARTPKAFVAAAYGPPEAWRGKKRPVCYELAFQRWHEGGIEAWLRQRGLEAVAVQSRAVREQLPDHPFAAFETVLRLLDPKLPPVTVCAEGDSLGIVTIPFGRQRPGQLRYITRGPGMPFGAVVVSNEAPGVQVKDQVLSERAGEIAITFDSGFGQNTMHTYRAELTLDSGVATFAPSPVVIRYRVEFPLEITLLRVIIGFISGFLVLALPRLGLCRLGEPNVISLANRSLNTLWKDVTTGGYPLLDFALALGVLFCGVFLGLLIWFRMLKKSEV
jgi:serine/threonine protein kinase